MQRSRRGSYGFGMLILSGALAFGTTPREVAAASPASQAPVEFFGCTALKGTAQQFSCMLVPDDQLTLWVRGRDCKDIQVADSGQPLQTETKFIQGGCQFRLPRSSGLHQSTLTLTDRRTQQPLWSMPLDRSKPRLLEWKRKVWDRAASNLEDILPDLQRRATERLDPEELIDVTYALALVHYRLGNSSEAIIHLDYVHKAASSSGYRSIAFDARYKKSDFLLRYGMSSEARDTLDSLRFSSTPGESRSASLWNLESGLIYHYGEDFAEASQRFASSISIAERVADQVVTIVAMPLLFDDLGSMNRLSEVEQYLPTYESLIRNQSLCRQAGMLEDLASLGIHMLAIRPRTEELKLGQQSIRDWLSRALELRQKCNQSNSLAKIYWGFAALDNIEGDINSARAWLAKASAQPGKSEILSMHLLEEEGLVAMKLGQGAVASRLFSDLMNRAQQAPGSLSRRFACTAAMGQLEAQKLLNQTDPSVSNQVHGCIENTDRRLAVPIQIQIKQRARNQGILAP